MYDYKRKNIVLACTLYNLQAIAIILHKKYNTMQFSRFVDRAIRYVGHVPVADYLERMRDVYDEDLPLDENNRVLYFFPQEKALELGGKSDSVLVGFASKNGKFERLSNLGTPNEGEIKTMRINRKTIETVLFTPSYTEGAIYMSFTSGDYSTQSAFEAYIKPKLNSGNETIIMNFSSESNMVAFNLQRPTGFRVNAFLNDTEVIEILDLAGQIQSLGENCFRNATSLTGTLLPSLTSIPKNGFLDCTNFVNNYFGENLISLGDNAFKNCIGFIPSPSFGKTATIGVSAFEGCNAIETINMPNLVKMGARAFKDCGALLSVEFESLQTISESAFEGCILLETANVVNATTTQKSCFKNCYDLHVINMANLENVAESAFEGCSSMTAFDFTVALTAGVNAFKRCTSVTNVDLQNATSIGDSCFEGCTAATLISILAATTLGATTGNNRVFYGCTYSGLRININSSIQNDSDILDAQAEGANIVID